MKKSKVIGMIIAFGCAVLGMEALGIQPVKTVYAQEAADQIITMMRMVYRIRIFMMFYWKNVTIMAMESLLFQRQKMCTA